MAAVEQEFGIGWQTVMLGGPTRAIADSPTVAYGQAQSARYPDDRPHQRRQQAEHAEREDEECDQP